jgi:hypothetical protein
MAMTKEEREAYWRELLAKQAASGLSGRAWCVREAVSYTTFTYWRRRLGQPAAVAPLTLIRVDGGEAEACALWLSVGGARIEVRPGFDAGLLKRVVAALVA